MIDGYVYIVQCGPHYKIGYSKSPDKRIEQLSTQPPFDLETCYLLGWHNARGLERQLHVLFANRRVKGEWFELNPHDLEMLKDIHKLLAMFNYSSNKLALYGVDLP